MTWCLTFSYEPETSRIPLLCLLTHSFLAESPQLNTPPPLVSLHITSWQTLYNNTQLQVCRTAIQLKASAIRKMHFINYDDGQRPGKHPRPLAGKSNEWMSLVIESGGHSAAGAPVKRQTGRGASSPIKDRCVPWVTSSVGELDLGMLAWKHMGLFWVGATPHPDPPGPPVCQSSHHITEQYMLH